MKKRIGENLLLLPVGVILTPIVFAFATIGTILSIPVLIRCLPWRVIVTRPHRAFLALLLLTLRFVAHWIGSIGYAKVFFGRSLARDTHPRGWMLPFQLRVAHRLALTVARYFGMDNVPRLQRAVHERIVAWVRANPPAPEQVNLAMPIVDASTLAPGEFYRRFVADAHPVVLRGFAANSQAVSKWTPEYFRRYAEELAPVATTGSEYEQVAPSRLGEYLDYIAANCDLPPEQRSAPQYLANFANLCNRHPELMAELDPTQVAPLLVGGRKAACQGAHLFIGLSGTGTPFHCAVAPNFFYQIQGQKRWTFVHPDHTPLMYPVVGGDTYFSGSLLEYPEPRAEILEQDYPLWKYCPRFEVVLEPGDVLFNPAWYWHRIRNETSPTIGSASRWLLLPTARSNALFDFFLIYHARFFPYLLDALCKRQDEPRVTDETTLSIEQRRRRRSLFERLRAELPSRREQGL